MVGTDTTVTLPRAELDALHAKLDRISSDLAVLADRQRRWDDLRADLVPIANEAYDALVTELASLDGQVTLEDLLGLALKLVRNARTLSGLFDQLSSMAQLAEDLGPLSKEFLAASTERLDALERRGYFSFLKEALLVVDRIVEAFSPEDVHALGDNIVFILQTVRNLTQPDMMRLLNRIPLAVRSQDVQVPKGLFGLLRMMRDEDVRRGLGVAIAMLRELPRANEAAAAQAPDKPAALEAPSHRADGGA